MLYSFLISLIDQFSALNVFRYLTFRTGLTFKYHDKLSLSCLFTYISEQFSDATNSTYDPDAVVGLIPSYYVLDLGVSYEIHAVLISNT